METPQTTIKYLERAIYKTFQDFKSQDTIKLSEFLSKLKLEKAIANEELIRFSKLAIAKALIFMELKNIKSHRLLLESLLKNEDDALNLGFYRNADNKIMIPSQQSFSYFSVHKLALNERELIELVVKKIKEIAEKFDIRFDIEYVKPVTKTIEKTNFQYQKEQKTIEFCKYLRKAIYPKLKLDMGHNAKYTKNNILDVLVHSAIEGSFTHGGAESYKTDIRKFNLSLESPRSNTILHHVKKYDAKSVKSKFVIVFDEIIRLAKHSGIFRNRKVNVAIDYFSLPYYGDVNHPNIIRSKYDDGTDKYFRFATLDIVEDCSLKFTICVRPVFVFDRMDDVVRELLEYAKNEIHINKLYADRGFGNANVFNLLESMNIKYVIPVSEDRVIKKIMKMLPPPHVLHNHKRGNATIKSLVLVKGKKGLMKLATNIVVNQRDVELIENLPRMYSKRWGIETGYRTKKREGLVRTTSNNYAIRLFYFLFSVALYNLWGLINLLLMLELGFGTLSRRKITFKLFCKNFYEFILT